ncbi:MAG: hypothetical protein IKM64_01055 [Clostridia bacterium]|nr:hypothetical protein [Clostridia bacterium]
MAIYYIGGSPCSGKSTAAEAIAERYGFHYFKVDDHLDRYMQLAAEDGKPCCARIAQMSPEEIWMRDPAVQCEEELQIYREIFPYVMTDLEEAASKGNVITEGAAFLPELVKKINIPWQRYIAITPVKTFQVFHYKKREWVPYVLAECSDRERAFDNWMERDALFAGAVQRQCEVLGYASIINDGTVLPEQMLSRVTAHFGLDMPERRM